jgi:hypothetical protein
MLSYLREYMHACPTGAPVFASLAAGGGYGRFILRFVDTLGVVLSLEDKPEEHVAYPWASISSITPRPETKRSHDAG